MKTHPLTKYQKKIAKVAKANHVSYLALFGSYARGEQKKNSDIDFLVKFSKPIGFFELLDTEDELSHLLGKKVDLVTKDGLSKYIKPYIQDDLTTIYEKSA
ncbi:nucleotidyltransferase family protein [Patescibacteria group bacterium]|nr:nucleotidyltransferase family protein [Patescibacteria group bacterium]